MNQDPRRVPFWEARGGREFNASFTKAVGDAVRRRSEELIPPENHGRFYHGRRFSVAREDGSSISSDIEGHSVEGQVGFEDLVQGRFATLSECVESIARRMNDALEKSLYSRVAEDAKAVGNTVIAEGRPTTETFLEMLQKIEFSVDRTGSVSRPSIHAGPETVGRLIKDLGSAGPAFNADVEALMKRKDEEALQRERDRLARFKRPA